MFGDVQEWTRSLEISERSATERKAIFLVSERRPVPRFRGKDDANAGFFCKDLVIDLSC